MKSQVAKRFGNLLFKKNNFMEVRISYIILVILVGFIVPIYSMISGGENIRKALSESPELKKSMYVQSVIFQWIMVGLILLSLFYNGDELSSIGLGFLDQPFLIAGLFGGSFLSLWIFANFDIPTLNLEKFRQRYKDVMFLIPTNQKEHNWAVVLSFTAGICEEIIFRGFTFWQLTQFLPIIPSILIVNLLFALSHFATKMKNMLLAFTFGIFWSITFIWTGSLWLAMLMHIIIDLYSLTRGKRYFERIDSNVV